MKKTLYFLAVVIASLCTACDHYDHAIADQGDRIEQLEKLTIKNVEDQITSINSSMENLEAVDKELDNYIKALEAKVAELEKQSENDNSAELAKEIEAIKTLIEDLKKKDAELDKKIEDLKKYLDDEITATEDWAEATFATLEQYSDIQTEISELSTLIADQKTELTEAIEDAIETLETSMQTWVNEVLAEGYYDIAAIDAKLNALEKKLADADADLAKQIKDQQAALEQAKKDLTEAYEKAISEAIETNNGVIEKAIADAVEDVLKKVDTKLAVIDNAIAAIQKDIETLKNSIEAFKEQIGSINKSIEELEKMDEELEKAIEALKNAGEYDEIVEALQKKDAELDKKIDDLKKYLDDEIAATEDWAEKTFATLTQFSELMDDLSDLSKLIDQNKTDLEKALGDAVKTLQDQIDQISTDIEDILDRLDTIEEELGNLKEDFNNRIQSIRFLPEYSDGKVELVDQISLEFMLAPKAAAGNVTKDQVTAFISRTKERTKAAEGPTALEVVSVTGDATGILKVVVSTTGLSDDFWAETGDANIFICISDGNNDIISEMIPIVSMERLDTEEELVAALETGEVKIEDDITLTGPITIPAAVTKSSGTNEVVIDLNGHVLSYTSTVQGEAMITNKGNLTIKDSKTGGKLSFTYAGEPDTNYGKGNYTIANCGALTIESGIIENNTAKMSHASYAIDNNSTIGNTILTINGGKVVNHQSVAIRQFCNGNENTVNINNGEIEGSRAIWTQLPGNNINTAPVVNLTIKGGVLTSLGETSGGYDYKMAIYSYTFGNSVQNVKYKIDGGTFNGDIALLGSSDNASQTVEITGGTFNGFDGCLYSWGDDTAVAEAIKITGGTFSDVYPLTYVGNGESTTVKLIEDFATEDYKIKINSGATVTFDLNEKTVSHQSTTTGANVNFIDVQGTLTVKNGTITTEHIGTNMGWNSSTNVFNVTAGGILNIKDAVCKNLGGSDMNFVAHLNNWGEVTLNVEDSELEAPYVAVRVFNSGYDMNNVTIKNTVLTGGRCIWVHNYTIEDFGTQEKVDAQKALLNFNDILNAGNTFNYTKAAIRLGFTNSSEYDANGNLL